MNREAWRLVCAARVPSRVTPQEFGLWRISREYFTDGVVRHLVGFPSQTALRRFTIASALHGGEVVMEDSRTELRKHLPIWMVAHGRVLVTGLGLGCVVRGLLAKPEVTHVDVVELDAEILRVIGPEFLEDPRVNLHHGDALELAPQLPGDWDFAWHDLWTDEEAGERPLPLVHADLMCRLVDRVGPGRQGAWHFPREMGRLAARTGARFIGAPSR